ncbi:ATP-binding cassette domain-containing protein [Paenibacillus sp. HB172176]|uniref:ABC transporter ATP-binding protein n=1 Tax=Paenibacillus sp. HB172176 TaxID=2493690 RepID=UPI001438F51A|nr:ATP-binding cassette domain-containing protein [Paenibacillus sp. HB172176]
MSQIIVDRLNKTYRQAIREPGLKGAIKHLYTQRYVDKCAVSDISFTINKGDSIAFLGPNGAGKSTTIKMLSGILVPTSGSVRINGKIPHQNRMTNAYNIGVVFGQRTQLWLDLPIRESFSLLKDIYSIPREMFDRNMERFIELLDLDQFLHLPARKLSLGQRMRADLAAALLHNPPIIFLDEPTIGLDISVKTKIRSFIKQINKEQGTTVLLTTHDLEDIEDICRRLIVIDKGIIIYDGALDELRRLYGGKERTIHLQLKDANELHALMANIRSKFQVNHIHNNGNMLSIGFDGNRIAAGEIVGYVMLHTEVIDFKFDETRIDGMIRNIYEGNLKLTGDHRV